MARLGSGGGLLAMSTLLQARHSVSPGTMSKKQSAPQDPRRAFGGAPELLAGSDLCLVQEPPPPHPPTPPQEGGPG